MLFNSIDFAVFLPLSFLFYWFVVGRSLKVQNVFLLFISYLFYGWWDWHFLGLIILSSMLDYIIGRGLGVSVTPFRRKLLLCTSIAINLGVLAYYKYFNFFLESFVDAFTLFGAQLNVTTLQIILPVGISFYTFQTLSYSIDVYKGKLEPTKDIIAFFSFVTFFPQLVAGPIERATSLLPQFLKKREFSYGQSVDGLRQILWGLVKKIVIADNCAVYVNDIFANHETYGASTLLLGGILFAFQIYGDFSGYSDIAIGTARLFGFNLMRNFAFPYFSRDIAEFWRRWHISLSTWFRDYIYIPLGGSKGGLRMKIINTFIIFLVSGFWHGANWTFVVWGLLNAIYFLPLMLSKQNRSNLDIVAEGRLLPSIKEVGQIGLTFMLTVIAWIFFRADNVQHALAYIAQMGSLSLFSVPDILPKKILLLISLFVLIEWVQREKQHALEIGALNIPKPARWSIYYAILFIIFWFGGIQQQFIYFQF